MILRQIYETLNEDSVLKSIGPFKIVITDNSIGGINKGKEEIYKYSISGETTLYGETVIVEKES